MRSAILLWFFLLLLPAMPSIAWSLSYEGLAADGRWQALLHVNRGATLRSRGKSYVADERFFFAKDGRKNPVNELIESARILSVSGAPERCRFPARYRFLAQSLGWLETDPLAHCEEYIEWRNQIPGDEVVLVFPAAYLNSPSSMFGHTLLRFGAADQESVWHAWAVNFGALVTPDDNSIFYIYRGLAGGYPGRFATVSYISKIQEYAHLENRDMWEYRLDLNAEEVAWMIDHLWELRDIDFAYYFLDENCSFRLLELIEVARPSVDLLSNYRFAEVPVNTVRAVDAAGLIAERVYRPSKAMELGQITDQLSVAEQRLARQLIRDPAAAESPAFLALAAEQRHLVARAAYQALRFKDRSRDTQQGSTSTAFALLRIMHANPAPALPVVQPPEPPEDGHATKMLAVSGGQRDDVGFAELQYRLTYHDWLDNHYGFLDGAWIEALNVRLRRSESDRIRLWQLDLVNIRSLAPRTAFVKPVSWFVHAGIDRPEVEGRRGANRFLQGGAGLAWEHYGLLPYVYAMARAENTDAQTPFVNVGAGAELGVLRHGGGYSLHLSSQSLYFADDQYRHRLSAGVQFALSREQGIRLSATQDHWRGEREFGWMASWRYYFD